MILTRRHIIYVVVLCIVLFNAKTNGIEAGNRQFFMEATFIEKQAHPGDVVTLKLLYTLPEGARLPEKPLIMGLEEYSVISKEIGSREASFQLIVDVLDTFEIPELTLSFLDRNDEERKMTSGPIQLEVVPHIKTSSEDLSVRTIKDIMPVKWIPWKRWLPFVLIALVVLAAFGIWYVLRKRKGTKEKLPYSEPPDRIALRALDDLQGSGLFEKGHIKPYYFALSEIVRRYMEEIRSFPAYEWTTEEIAAYVRDDEDRQVVKLLKKADLIKFADEHPTLSQKEEHVSQVRLYIEKTHYPVLNKPET